MNNEINVTQHTDCYFTKSLEAAAVAGVNPTVVYQVFQKQNSVFCGMEFAGPLFLNAITMSSLNEGQTQKPFEPSIVFTTRFQDMVEPETVYLGIIARCTLVATNVRRVVDAANGKLVFFFPARFDVPDVQVYDGYAAAVGGAAGCATPAQTCGYNRYMTRLGKSHIVPVGTNPHALIAAFRGDTAAAALAFADARPLEQVWALVDFHNDCAKTAVEVAKAFEAKGMLGRLSGVRLDTSEKLIDYGIAKGHIQPGEPRLSAKWLQYDKPYCGVCPELVKHVRQALNEAGYSNLKITVSGGFTADKIQYFESHGVPADVYAVGESLIRGANPYTSDVVGIMESDGLFTPCGKIGRTLGSLERLTCRF